LNDNPRDGFATVAEYFGRGVFQHEQGKHFVFGFGFGFGFWFW
jgi:hypothetical protein